MPTDLADALRDELRRKRGGHVCPEPCGHPNRAGLACERCGAWVCLDCRAHAREDELQKGMMHREP